MNALTGIAEAGGKRAEKWRWTAVPAGIAIASRALSVLLVSALNVVYASPYQNPFTIWDARWYLGIAENGYHSTPILGGTDEIARLDIAFLPAWPSLIRLSTLGFLPDGVTSVVLANLLFVVAAVLLWRLLADRLDPPVATRSIALLAFSPAAYVFSLAYSESLFLLIAVLFFLAPPSSLWRGPLAALSMVTRISGAAIVFTAAVQVLRTSGPVRRAAVLAVIGGILGFAALWVTVGFVMQEPLGFLRRFDSWPRYPALEMVVNELRYPTVQGIAWLSYPAVMLVGAVLVLRRDRELGIYAIATLALPVITGGVIVNSMPRYALLAFPAFAGLASRLGRRSTTVLLLFFVIAQCLFVRWVIAGVAP